MNSIQRSLLALGAAVMVFSLGACSDDDTVTPSNNKQYYPTTSGSFWVYNTFTIDSTGAQSTEIQTTDSLVAGSKKMIGGKNATEFINHMMMDGQASHDTSYSYSENSQIYNYINISEFSPLGDMEANSMWVKSADFNASGEWQILDQTLPPVQLPLGFFTGDTSNETMITMTPKFTSKARKGITKQVSYSGKTHSAQEIVTTTSVSMSNLIFGGVPTGQSINFNIINKAYFVENIGMVQSITEPTTINLPLGMGSYSIEGDAQILIRHNVK